MPHRPRHNRNRTRRTTVRSVRRNSIAQPTAVPPRSRVRQVDGNGTPMVKRTANGIEIIYQDGDR